MADPTIGTNAEIFDPTKEKKKKKKKVLDLDSLMGGSSASSASAAQAEEDAAHDGGTGTGGTGGLLLSGERGEDNEAGAHDDILESLENFGSKKKKKKSKKVMDGDGGVEDVGVTVIVDVAGTPGEGGEEGLDFDFSKKKKKKGKAGAALDDLVAAEDASGTPAPGDDNIVLVDRQSSGGEIEVVVSPPPPLVSPATSLPAVVITTTEEVESGYCFDSSSGSASVVPETSPDIDGSEQTSHGPTAGDDDSTSRDIQFNDDGDDEDKENDLISQSSSQQPQPKSWLSSDRDYTYDELLTRVFEIMRAKNPEMVSGTKQKFVMRPPQVVRIGTKKTSFVNFMEICKMLHRHQKHLLDFLLSELGTSGSIDGNNQLIIKGRFQQKQIENVLRRYIKEYVTCHTCRSPNTLLQKDFRLFFLQCEACGSRCSVASIKHGFQAVTGKRAAMRAKAN